MPTPTSSFDPDAMEKIRSLCVMKELFQALTVLENRLIDNYGVTLNEAMVLCSVGSETVSAGTIAECTGLAPSHLSKVIRSAEKKELLIRTMGSKDKRQMYFSLTSKAEERLNQIREQGLEIPQMLQALFE